MKKIEIATTATLYNDVSELSSEDKMLMNKAIEARHKAYAPYSKFNVGAALLLENNEIILGNNQENAAYPSGMCAERVAIWKAGSDFPGVKILKLAITASSSITKVDKPVGPCGACRQSLSEYEIKQKQSFPILFMGEVGEIVKTESLLSLLPFSFDSSYL
ncbi:cytidine deaminase [Polaribacter reichenbachii]|uniref:Cytidine deaminase n=1 Tax=Polaribacter reichenbachii TaxID=996801 RepID=A0A1B8U3D2_9FLAO|nr:cytidine deaminase [Polaribacter reichenbachii]APZ46564.1 cytidine deaminase [Polaribacter reichenbachii]AUC17210.1 cytidine deaminase [Polaribacter reichenbachii]OBY66388.1 cytidine deaminase [Polaribacter reichenbachii]